MAKRLLFEDRIRLETLLKLSLRDKLGFPLSQTKRIVLISNKLGVNASTIYREVSINGFTYDNYNGAAADKLVKLRISNSNKHYRYSKCQKESILNIFRDLSRDLNWSLNSFILRMSIELPEVKIPSLETLYSWIYAEASTGGCLYKLLSRHHKRRHKRICRPNLSKIKDRVSIDFRPEVVNRRERIGDFEADSVVSCGNRAGILTATDRKSRLVASTKVQSKCSLVTNKAIIKMLKRYRPKTITTDNGFEFAGHKRLSMELRYRHYHADPYASYQRGSNEHSNGMIRRYFPKGTDFETITEEELQKAIWKINHLPRKIFQGLSAHEVYYGIKKTMIRAKYRKIIHFAFRT